MKAGEEAIERKNGRGERIGTFVPSEMNVRYSKSYKRRKFQFIVSS